jgi:hypothetical protein
MPLPPSRARNRGGAVRRDAVSNKAAAPTANRAPTAAPPRHSREAAMQGKQIDYVDTTWRPERNRPGQSYGSDAGGTIQGGGPVAGSGEMPQIGAGKAAVGFGSATQNADHDQINAPTRTPAKPFIDRYSRR